MKIKTTKLDKLNPDNATNALKRAAQMPPIESKIGVVDWLCQQPTIRQAIFDWYQTQGAIVFRDDRWRGAEHSDREKL